jgi:membrane protease YdiL (CAAX protease family)
MAHTAIGQRLNSSPARLAAATAVASLAVAGDLALVRWGRLPESTEGRGVLALTALAVHLWLVRGDLASVGLGMPVQGWRYWGRAAALLGLVVAACLVLGLGAWVLSGHPLPLYATDPRDLGAAFLRACVFAPVLEETTYRLVVCVPLSACLGPRTAIAVSGLAFAGLHVAYGNPSPENLVGGFLLAWAYLKSGSVVVPVLLHGSGNLVALAWQVATWYWLRAVA